MSRLEKNINFTRPGVGEQRIIVQDVDYCNCSVKNTFLSEHSLWELCGKDLNKVPNVRQGAGK